MNIDAPKSHFSPFEEILLEEVINTADSLIVISDVQGKIKLFNRKAQEITGYQPEEVVGEPWVRVFVPPVHQAKIQKVFNALQSGKTVSRNEKYPILNKKGKELLIAWDRSFIKDRQGRAKLVLSVGHDLTPFRIMEEERSHTQTILDSIADGVMTVDPNLKIISFNKAATRITGFAREEALGQYCHDIFRSNLCASSCPMKESISSGKELPDLEKTILSKQNKEIPLNVSTNVWRDQNGNPIGGILVFRDLTPITELKKELLEKYSFQDIISKNKVFLELFEVLPDIAKSDATVLVTGESGTGKELVAKALHQLSSRKDRPFIKVNCGALPETLLESELFGYKRGAFTDAKQDKPGRFKLAEGGTLFLDEIGDISLAIQSKLLRVLETKEYEPLGGTRTEKADVRVVSATNKNLWSQVQLGEFREDLYYRLNLFPIEIPPLRDRPEDIPLLIEHFLSRFNHTKGRTIAGLTHSAMEILLNHRYPGNVRELQNIIEHAFILCKKSHIGPESLPAYLKKKHSYRYENGDAENGKRPLDALDDFEKGLILETLQKHGGKLEETAREMGIHRATLWRKMKKMKIAKEGPFDLSEPLEKG
jgi:PAS domain S-box-containing protein